MIKKLYIVLMSVTPIFCRPSAKEFTLSGPVILQRQESSSAKDLPQRPTLNHAQILITSGHNHAFGKSNLLESKLEPDEHRSWQTALDLTAKFIQQNNPALLDTYSTVTDINRELIRILKAATEQTDITQIESTLKPLKDIQQRLKNISRNLTRRGSIISTKQRQESKKALEHLVTTLDATIDKIFIDLNKLKKPKFKQSS